MLPSRTGIELCRFDYNSDGALIRITDGDSNVTSIERAGRTPSAIVAPGGQRTVLTTDTRGYLTAVADPGGNTTRMTYDDNALLLTFTTPNGHQSTMVYDEKGNLNGFWNLSFAELGRRTTTTMETAEGRLFGYTFERRRDGITERTATNAAGLLTRTLVNPNGTRTLTTPDGSVVTSTMAGDPRWGLDVPMTKALTMRLPSGLTSTVTAERALELGTPGDPFSLLWQEEYIYVNGRFFYLSWDTALRTTWSCTPENRETIAIRDGQGRVTWLKGPGVLPVSFSYDTKGRLTEITQGERTATIGYDTQNRPTTLTDALLRQVQFTYDPASQCHS